MSSLTAHLRILVAAVLAVGIAVAAPAVEYAASAGLALEVRQGAGQIAVLFIAAVAAIVDAIANGCRGCAVGVLALEGAGTTMSRRTGRWLIGAILAVLLAIALPEPRNALLVAAAAQMLTRGAVGNAGLRVACQIELIGTGALVDGSTLFDVALDIQVGRLRRRCYQTQMRAASVVLAAGIGVGQLA